MKWAPLALLLLCCACEKEPPPLVTTFYHWETTLAPDERARSLLTDHDRLYVKAFDVVWSGTEAVPAAEIVFGDTASLPVLAPVVFLTNEVMANTSLTAADRLAEDILVLLHELFPGGFPALQLDCDWTARTQVQYFGLLRAMQERAPSLEVTCTVRLHQFRDRTQQGAPPVHRATLMAYNTGNLNDWSTNNSIVDTAAFEAYLAGQPPYPLPLDIAVAVYDWATVYRRGKLVHLINEPDLQSLADTSKFTPLPPLSSPENLSYAPTTAYQALRSTYLNGIHLYAGDLLRHEVAAPGRLTREAARLRSYIGGFAGQRMIIYRLGSRLWDEAEDLSNPQPNGSPGQVDYPF